MDIFRAGLNAGLIVVVEHSVGVGRALFGKARGLIVAEVDVELHCGDAGQEGKGLKREERLVKAGAGDIADLIITLVERNIKQTCCFNSIVIGLAI